MAWELRKIEFDQGVDKATGKAPVAGDWWYAPWFLRPFAGGRTLLSDEYFAHAQHRDPVVIMLPGGVMWCPDRPDRTRDPNATRGWKVTGDEGKWSAHPSVDWKRVYHGWLTDGVLSDDIEGRRF